MLKNKELCSTHKEFRIKMMNFAAGRAMMDGRDGETILSASYIHAGD